MSNYFAIDMSFKFVTKSIYVIEKSIFCTSGCFGKCECGIFFSRDYWQRDHVVATYPRIWQETLMQVSMLDMSALISF